YARRVEIASQGLGPLRIWCARIDVTAAAAEAPGDPGDLLAVVAHASRRGLPGAVPVQHLPVYRPWPRRRPWPRWCQPGPPRSSNTALVVLSIVAVVITSVPRRSRPGSPPTATGTSARWQLVGASPRVHRMLSLPVRGDRGPRLEVRVGPQPGCAAWW